ncbi:hypothetical protein CPB84DRAFT_1790708 [Gymnopilus junonius]|uniref:Uncharacterized protein n=1 Tax=Gymnopilus junonius TaxID=109634 RepID=A0A9P5THW5_GYMJU|nr:hypothetical protein CPB84DRAFT_1790708 [Gymnopilus junonius]
MPLKTGIYHIRWVPKHIKLPFIGGVYATGDAQNAPVRAEALHPDAGNQKWRVAPIEGKKDTYQITYPGITLVGNEGPFVTSWASSKKGGEAEPVTLAGHIAEWIITVVDEEHSVYRISEPHGEIVGAVRYVTEEYNLLYVKSYPIILDLSPLPSWQFVHVSE